MTASLPTLISAHAPRHAPSGERMIFVASFNLRPWHGDLSASPGRRQLCPALWRNRRLVTALPSSSPLLAGSSSGTQSALARTSTTRRSSWARL